MAVLRRQTISPTLVLFATAPREAMLDQCTGGEFTRFFNPRTDRWAEHFRLEQAAIRPLTTVGEATARILGFNDSARLHEREEMIRFGKYPSEVASAIMAVRST
ncbi:MAG TPA: hypothetical protein VE135_03180 [Pyrinomonadaceae bacterium]|nr:hypothetical protein [Pyrinomonadaceae bacterium]